MIVGIGIDVVPIVRVEKMIARQGDRVVARVLTDRERATCAKRGKGFAQSFAARIAAKEACIKALGNPKGLAWHDMEVVSRTGGRPELRFAGVARRTATRLRVVRMHVSLSHAGGIAAAVVVLER